MQLHRPPSGLSSRVLAALLALLLLVPGASATWSIVAVDTRTGEVCIAAATCLPVDLEIYLPVVRVGVGGACAQSKIDQNGNNRRRIWNGLANGLSADEILERLLAAGPQLSRQYGIVTLDSEPATYTGPTCGNARYGVARTVDGVRYAMQGNVLAGIQVITHAENLFLTTPGDLAQKVLAAMEGARVYGGDGRCSCDSIHPTECGCPPPAFTRTAACAFLILARIGDVDGACDATAGCATGQYFCELNLITAPGQPDPVFMLHDRYAAWRAGKAGRADQVRSRVRPNAERLPADGVSAMQVDVDLYDIEGNLATDAGASVSVAAAYGGPPVASIGAVQEISPGRFRFPLTATTQTGEGRFRVTVQYPDGSVLLWPELVVQVDPVTELHCGYSEVSAAAGASVPLTVNMGAPSSGRPYLILASASGTVPGQTFQGVHLPLNDDYLFQASLNSAGTGRFPGTSGNLDAAGRAVGRLVAAPGALSALVGRHIDWSAVIFDSPNYATAVAGFDVAP